MLRTAVACAGVMALAAAGLLVMGWLHPEPEVSGRTLSQWLAQLHDSSPAKRQEAAEALQRMGPEALPYLTGELTKEPNALQRGAAAASQRAPGFLKGPLTRIAQRGHDVANKHMALQAIGLMGTNGAPAVPAVGEVLRQDNVGLMSAAATAMIHMGTNSLPELIASLDDGSFDTRSHACFALRAMGTNAAPAVPRLRQIIEEERGAIMAAAVATLARIGDPAVATLEELLGHTNAVVRQSAAFALGYVKPRPMPAVPALMKAAGDEEAAVRAAAIRTLGGIDFISAESGAVLLRALGDSNADVRAAAVNAASIRPRLVIEHLDRFMELLEDEGLEVRMSAARAVGQTGQHAERAIPGLRRMLEDTNEVVRRSAADALGCITNSMDVVRRAGGTAQGFAPAVGVERRIELRDQ